MKKTFTSFLVFVASLFMCNNILANGEHTIKMESEYFEWYDTTEWFDANTIADELGTDSETLFKAIDTWSSIGYASEFFTLKLPTGEWSYEHGSAGDGAYYIDENGGFLDGWGSAAAYVRLDTDEDNNKIGITIGQVGNYGLGDIKSVNAINLNGSTVIFNTTLSVCIPKADKETTTTIANLNIVGRQTFTLLQSPQHDWESESYGISVKGMCEALDIKPEYMAENLKALLYAKTYDNDLMDWGTELAHNCAADPYPGMYFSHGVYIGETAQEESQELVCSGYDDDYNKFYIAGITYDNSSDSITFEIGQYPDSWSLNENRTADVYFVYGDKAYILTIDMTVGTDPSKTIAIYNKVGEQTITVSRDPSNGTDVLDTKTLNMDAILAKFPAGTTLDQLVLYSQDETGVITKDYTTDATGFWFDADYDGVIEYTEDYKSYFINYADGKLQIGNQKNVFDGGEESTANLYFICGQDYYGVTVDIKISEPKYTFEDCAVTEYKWNVEVTHNADDWENAQVDGTFLKDIIGTLNGKLYGVDANGSITTSYSTSEANGGLTGGGFWMSPADENGYAYSGRYSSTGAFAMWYYQNVFHFFNVPDYDQTGQTITATFYVANLWEGKAVKLNLNLKYVGEIYHKDIVGQEDIKLAARGEDGKSYAVTSVDLASCIKTLNTDAEEFGNNGDWFALDAEHNEIYMGDLTDDSDKYGFMFDEDGNYVTDKSQAKFAIGYYEDGFHSFVFGDDDANVYTATVYAVCNGNNYGFNVTISNSATSITSVAQENAAKAVSYDLNGRQIANPSRQIVIRDGRKIYVK